MSAQPKFDSSKWGNCKNLRGWRRAHEPDAMHSLNGTLIELTVLILLQPLHAIAQPDDNCGDRSGSWNIPDRGGSWTTDGNSDELRTEDVQ